MGGNDNIRGFGGDDIICGGDGDDKVEGQDGNDKIFGSAGNDELFGNEGDDKIFSGSGNDTVEGGIGNDLLFGGPGTDQLFGNEDDDQIFGGENIDELFGGEGKDNCYQGESNDGCESFTFFTSLEGAEEVPSVITDASGGAMFVFNATGSELLRFRITVENLDLDGNQTGDVNDDVTAAHIHLASSGVNGPIVVGFISPKTVDNFQSDPVAGVTSGIITSDSLINDLAGQELSALITEIISGNTYVNIHTVGNPGGEIRGQI